jgi:hypothetical protein
LPAQGQVELGRLDERLGQHTPPAPLLCDKCANSFKTFHKLASLAGLALKHVQPENYGTLYTRCRADKRDDPGLAAPLRAAFFENAAEGLGVMARNGRQPG